MTKNISKAVEYYMNDGHVCVGICDEINWDKKEIKLKEAYSFENKEDYDLVKSVWDILDKTDSFSIEMKDIKSAYIIN